MYNEHEMRKKTRFLGLAFGQTRNDKNVGFSLVELMVVISIIAILTTLLLVNFTNSRSRARDAQRKADLKQVKTALQLYFNDFQQFPPHHPSSNGKINTCGGNGCDWGEEAFTVGGVIYMNLLPVDPINTTSGGLNYVYMYTQTAFDTFQLSTFLENASDEEAERSQVRCGVSATDQLYVVCED